MPSQPLDAIDRKILAALHADGRLTNVDLADRVGLSPSPCLRRVRQLEADGVIRGYRAVLDRGAAGLGLTVFLEITVAQHSRENAALLHRTLAEMANVVACHMVTGTADFLAEIVVPDLAAYEALLTERLLTLPMGVSVRSNIVLRPIKTDGALPLAAS